MIRNKNMHPAKLRAAAVSALLLAAAGCEGPLTSSPTSGPTSVTAADWVYLPPDAVLGAGDPTRSAIFNTAYVFSQPAVVAGQPADAAIAAAQLDYLASEIAYGGRWREFNPTVVMLLRRARLEVRDYLGVPPDALPQAVVDRLYAASRALRVNDVTAAERILSPPVFPASQQTLARLASMPLLPIANQATVLAREELGRIGRINGRTGGGLGGGGGFQ